MRVRALRKEALRGAPGKDTATHDRGARRRPENLRTRGQQHRGAAPPAAEHAGGSLTTPPIGRAACDAEQGCTAPGAADAPTGSTATRAPPWTPPSDCRAIPTPIPYAKFHRQDLDRHALDPLHRPFRDHSRRGSTRRRRGCADVLSNWNTLIDLQKGELAALLNEAVTEQEFEDVLDELDQRFNVSARCARRRRSTLRISKQDKEDNTVYEDFAEEDQKVDVLALKNASRFGDPKSNLKKDKDTLAKIETYFLSRATFEEPGSRPGSAGSRPGSSRPGSRPGSRGSSRGGLATVVASAATRRGPSQIQPTARRVGPEDEEVDRREPEAHPGHRAREC